MRIPKVVLDTNVIVSALLNPNGFPGFIWRELISNDAQAFYSDEMLDEYREVLHRAKFPFKKKTVDSTLNAISRKFIRVIPDVSHMLFDDESDRIFYDTAIAVSATLVTGNMRHYPESPYVTNPSEFSIAYINIKLKCAAIEDDEQGA
jgi:putative PIN family toxin of toxin-antitoxin system